MYVAYQYAAAAGWDLDEALTRVHKSNLSKLDDDLRPIKRADGKVIKGPNYQPPTLLTLFDMTDRYIARTGRVQSWLDNPESKLPVSCTVFVVDDSMEGPDGIEASWRFVSHALRNAAGVAVHLSKLRPRGEENGKGLVASGPVSFARIYSVLNETLRRGGTYKNGACVIHLDANHTDIEEFVDASRAELPWVKKCIDVTPEWWNELTEPLQAKILKAIQAGDIWLNKVKYNQRGERIYGNVCLEIYLPSRGTCLLQHVNLGACQC